jgi:ribokinase
MGHVGVCGSANMDVIAYVPRLPRPGETLRADELRYAPGGKGANQAVAAARLGASVSFHGARGADTFGEQIAGSLRDAGVDVAHLDHVEEPTGVALILVAAGGENQIAVVAGANAVVAAPRTAVADVWLTQAEIPVEAVRGTLERSRSSGATAIVNPSPAGHLPAELVAQFDIAIVNEAEFAALDRGGPPVVIVTRGERGVRILPGGQELGAFPAQPLDTTGAGDAFAGGVAAGLAEGLALLDAVRLGMAAAAVCVERPGCQPAMPTRAEAEQRMARSGGR